jgi:hypothetical protein
MKKISDLFSDEEKKHLSFLGSMLRREPSEEEAEFEVMVDAWLRIKGKGEGPQAQNKQTQAEEPRIRSGGLLVS